MVKEITLVIPPSNFFIDLYNAGMLICSTKYIKIKVIADIYRRYSEEN